jgi:hypothetical protein
VQAVLRGSTTRAKYSHGLLEAAYNETVPTADMRAASNAAEMRDLGLDILKRVAMGQATQATSGRPDSLAELRPPSGEEALATYPKNLAKKGAQQAPSASSKAAEAWLGEDEDDAGVHEMQVLPLTSPPSASVFVLLY